MEKQSDIDKILRACLHYKQYTIYLWKEPGIKTKYIDNKCKIGWIRGGLKPIQLVTCGDIIGFP